MKTHPPPEPLPFDQPARYQIRVQGRIKASWSDRLEGMTITLAAQDGGRFVTSLEGELQDQAALAGVLNTIYELHLPVLEVKRMAAEQLGPF
jgi:hypothetical protein